MAEHNGRGRQVVRRHVSYGRSTMAHSLAGWERCGCVAGFPTLPPFRVLAVMIPCSLVIEWVLQDGSDRLRLTVKAGLLAVIGAWSALRFGLPADLVSEVAGKLPSPLRRLVCHLAGRVSVNT